uniref:Transmembrane protein n=1 Tax=Clandestinovirus TaxID=2831644 RepID=A0A8F8PMB2_9VIRU|nr:transmembrane protein [Clandestinovirus]
MSDFQTDWYSRWDNAKKGNCISVNAFDLIKPYIIDESEELKIETMDEEEYGIDFETVHATKQESKFPNAFLYCLYRYTQEDCNYAFKDFEIVVAHDTIDASLLEAGTLSILIGARIITVSIEYALLMASIAGKHPYIDENDPQLVIYPVMVTFGLPGGVLIPSKDSVMRKYHRACISLRAPDFGHETYLRFKKYDKRSLNHLQHFTTGVNIFGCFPLSTDQTKIRPNDYSECEIDTPRLMGFVIPYRSFMSGVRSVRLLVERSTVFPTTFREIIFDDHEIHLVKQPNGKKLCYIFGISSMFRDPELFVRWVKNNTIAISTEADEDYGSGTCHKHSKPYTTNLMDNCGDIKIEMDIDESEEFYKMKIPDEIGAVPASYYYTSDEECENDEKTPTFSLYSIEETFLGMTDIENGNI